MGEAKHGFILAMYCLMRSNIKSDEEIYDWAMCQSVRLGGDSDTNCAIVGGIVGAYAGLDNIPASKV